MQKYVQYKVSALDIQKQERFTFNTQLYNSFDLKSAIEFANNMKKNCSEFYCCFHLVKVVCEVVEVALI